MLPADSGRTRRSLLQAGAAAAIGVVGASTGSFAQAALSRRAATPESPLVAELRLFAGDYVPKGFLACDGDGFLKYRDRGLAGRLGDVFGGDRRLPDLRGRAVVGQGQVSDEPLRRVGEYGRALVARHLGPKPSTLGLTYLIREHDARDDPLVGEVRAFAFDFAPKGWEICDGRELMISHKTGLYIIIGFRFGGDGRKTFALPDLRGATPVGTGDSPAFPPTPIGLRRLNLATGDAGRRPRLHVNYCVATAGKMEPRQS